MNKVYILSGLPGSGKTYFAERMKEIYRENGDNLFVYHQDDKNFQWWLFQSFSDIIMDCLNLTNEEIIKCIKEVLKHIQLEQYHEFIIIRWKENREKCIKNDNGRREINSEKTIKHAIFEKPNLKQIKVETGITNLKLDMTMFILPWILRMQKNLMNWITILQKCVQIFLSWIINILEKIL